MNKLAAVLQAFSPLVLERFGLPSRAKQAAASSNWGASVRGLQHAGEWGLLPGVVGAGIGAATGPEEEMADRAMLGGLIGFAGGGLAGHAAARYNRHENIRKAVAGRLGFAPHQFEKLSPELQKEVRHLQNRVKNVTPLFPSQENAHLNDQALALAASGGMGAPESPELASLSERILSQLANEKTPLGR